VIERFAHPEHLAYVWAALALGGLLSLALYLSRRRAARLFDAALRSRLLPQRSSWRPLARAGLVTLAGAAIAAGVARPQANPTPTDVQRLGRDVCVIIDISNSMLAEDLRPNRLERAKLWTRDLLRSLSSDRVAVIAMAGSAQVVVPLTTDYGFARLAIDQLETTDASRGGTNIGDAIRLATGQVFDSTDARFRDIILITDGEDLEGSFPTEAASEAGELGFRVITLGLGSPNGSTIPITNPNTGRRELLTDDNGDAVVTRLDAQTLLDVARASDKGRFYDVGTGDIRLDRVYAALVEEAERRAYEETETLLYDELYWLFAAAALALLTLEHLVANRRAGVAV
jgi:Ca-activated chloride channel family protein